MINRRLLTPRECRVIERLLKAESTRLHNEASNWRTSEAKATVLRAEADELWELAKRIDGR